MTGLILKAPYYKPGHITEKGQSRGGYVEYIAKREGVEILRSGMMGYIGERRGSNGLFSDEGMKIASLFFSFLYRVLRLILWHS